MTTMREQASREDRASAQVVPLVSPIPATVPPRLSVSMRALVADLVILVVGMSIYVVGMVEAQKLYREWLTAAEATGLAAGWILLILFHGGYDDKYVGLGAEEFKRVVSASITLLAVVSTAAYIFLPESPPLRLVIPSLAIGLVLLLTGRWLLRIWLGHQRLRGKFLKTTLVVGEYARSALLVNAFRDDAQAGYTVIAQVEPPGPDDPAHLLDGWLDDVVSWVERHHVGAVAITDTGAMDPDLLKRLAWHLEGPRVDLLVSPLLYDVAGPRVSVRPASGLPLLHLDEPVLTGPKRVLKRAMDLAIAVPGMLLLTPVFAAIALAIKLDSRGPVFYVSERVGRSGTTFGCLKFRSMAKGADAQRQELIGVPDSAIVERYRSDPRITRVGHFLRRWSLDELPQVLNVITGSMSMVGPRPVLPEELDLLAEADLRRHITKPGLTGLWQISGRKEVAWEDRMRMDLFYIEHWSLALDLVIIAKTAKAVLTGRGAY